MDKLHKLRWKIHYTDGSTFSSKDGETWQAPGFGVQLIHQKYDSTVFFTHRSNYYIWKGGRWVEAEAMFDLWRYWFRDVTNEPKATLSGETIEEDDYVAIHKAAMLDSEFDD